LNGIDNTNDKSALTKQSKAKGDGAATKATTMTVKQSSRKHQEASRRELVDESSTVLCVSKSIHSVPGSGTLSQLLVT